MKSVEVQTDPMPSIEDKTEVLTKTLVTQLTVLIVSLMKINTNNPDEITNLIKQTTGVEVDKSLFKGEWRDLASNSAAAGSIQQCNMEKTLQTNDGYTEKSASRDNDWKKVTHKDKKKASGINKAKEIKTAKLQIQQKLKAREGVGDKTKLTK